MFKRDTLRSGIRGGGFTLVELLVTISIVAVLAVISMASYKKVVEKSQRTKCAGSLRILGTAAMQYAQDNDGRLPFIYDLRLGTWGEPNPGLIDLLGNYVNNDNRVFYCTDAEHCVPAPYRALSMTYNYQAAQKGADRFFVIGYFWLICKEANFDATNGGLNPPPKVAGSGRRVLGMCPHFGGSTVHNRLYNVLYADGHVDARKPDSDGNLYPYVSRDTLQFPASFY